MFGKRYREVIRGWDTSLRTGGANDRRYVRLTFGNVFLVECYDRINWSGSALNTFYAAVRKALVVVIVGRALGILIGLALSAWWLFWQ